MVKILGMYKSKSTDIFMRLFKKKVLVSLIENAVIPWKGYPLWGHLQICQLVSSSHKFFWEVIASYHFLCYLEFEIWNLNFEIWTSEFELHNWASEKNSRFENSEFENSEFDNSDFENLEFENLEFED